MTFTELSARIGRARFLRPGWFSQSPQGKATMTLTQAQRLTATTTNTSRLKVTLTNER